MSRVLGRVFLAAIFLMLSRQLTLAASGNQTMKLKDVAVGKVVQVGGIQFVRVGVNKYLATSLCPSGQLFASSTNNCMTIKEYGCKNPQTTMQRWSIGDCESLTTPTGTAYTSGPCLMDERDGKTYEVRKFADGKCWMTTNLKYHSGCDKIFYCGYGYNADETCITTAANAISVSNRIANGLYGDCRAAKDTVDDDGLEGTGTLQGNFYSYQAAVQDNNAHYGQNYQPSIPRKGICPDGWYLPSKDDYVSLSVITSDLTFWTKSGSWHAVIPAGVAGVTGGLTQEPIYNYYWTATNVSETISNSIYHNNVRFGITKLNKANGASVRCVHEYCANGYEWSEQYHSCIAVCGDNGTFNANKMTCDCKTNYEYSSTYGKCIATCTGSNQYNPSTDTCVNINNIYEYNYTGSEQTLTIASNGIYLLEVWGAEGYTDASSGVVGAGIGQAGYGGYAVGKINLTQGTVLHINVGGKANGSTGGYNGGGSGQFGGGGATHIALDSGVLSTLSSHATDNRILIVAGGGAANDSADIAGSGGGYIGGTSSSNTGFGGSQTAGGATGSYAGSFGKGGNNKNAGAGGGGYYGGSASTNSTDYGGGGGSGYIANVNLSAKHMSCYACDSSEQESTYTISNTCVSSDPQIDCAKSGHGFARITKL